MAKLSVTQAAKAAGISRTNFYKNYVKPGKLTVERDHQGRPQVDTSELMRVFGLLKGDVMDDVRGEHKTTPENTSGNNALERENQLLREQLTAAHEREEWMRKQLESLTDAVKQIEHKAAPKRRWWQFG